MASLEIQRHLTLNANPQTIYELISTPEGMAQWFSDEAQATDDGFVVKWRDNGKSVSFMAVVVDRAPNETFAYRTIEDMPTITRFILTDKSDGCQLDLFESSFSDTTDGHQQYEARSDGWDLFLGRLQTIANE